MDRLTRKDTIIVGKERAACNYENDNCNDSCMYGSCRWQEEANMLLKKYEDTGLSPQEILELKERVNDGWIPVDERLPEEKGVYLVTYHPCYWDNVGFEIRVGIDTFRGKTAWAQRKYQRVIAWRPLPEPYCPERRE